MAVDDVFRLTLTAFGQGSTYQNTYHLARKAEPDVTPAIALAAATDFKELFRAYQHQTVSYVSWRLAQVRGEDVVPVPTECRTTGGVFFDGSWTTSNAGGDAIGDPLPPQCAMVVTWRTGLIGRRARGRTFIFGQSEQQQVAGVWNLGQLSNMTTNLGTMFAEYGPAGTSADWQLGVWSSRTATGCEVVGNPPRLTNVETPNPAGAFQPITAYVLRNVVYTQRRRTVGRGA